MNDVFFQRLETALATERMDAYRQDGVGPVVTLGRYLWNMALCESLYSPLQIAEIALRNAIHTHFTARFATDLWFDKAPLLAWQLQQVRDAERTLRDDHKPVTAGRLVAELNFGFWTGFFNKAHGITGLSHGIAKSVFSLAPHGQRDSKALNARWQSIRALRNRVFHHERIIHWNDLGAQHADILRVTAWISPELAEMARALDRFTAIHADGLDPWIAKVRHHWPKP